LLHKGVRATYNALDNVKLDEKGYIKEYGCKECGFKTPSRVGLWGKDIMEMEAEHIQFLHENP
jgi:hypothetical protein